MKNIQNSLFVAVLFLTGQTSFSQIMCNDTNAGVDGTFGTSPAFVTISESDPNAIVYGSALHMDYFTNILDATMDDPYSPQVAKEVEYNNLHVKSFETGVTNGGFCFMRRGIDLGNDVDNKQELTIYLKDLEFGQLYEIGFVQVLIQSDIMDPEFSKAQFEVHVAGEVFYSAEMTPTVPPGPSGPAVYLTWLGPGFQFCPTSTIEKMTIIPKIVNPDPDHYNSVILGIDGISVSPKEDKLCDSPVVPCNECTSLDLVVGEKYIISGWTKQTNLDDSSLDVFTYTGSTINISFTDASNASILTPFTFVPTGEIIDGWQKIDGEFEVPTGATNLYLSLANDSEPERNAYFDDIRLHPINANLKSFVYDQDTHKLMAELDENNYATFYEYDKEGGLVRVKKETEKGVFTIQETRSSNVKSE